MKRSQISKAVKIALAGSALAFGAISTASAGTTMYNNYVSTGLTASSVGACGGAEGAAVGDACTGGTDGWASPAAGWSNSMGTGAAFDYVGSPVMHWGVHLGTAGDSAEISTQNSFDKYGVYADVDVAKGAWLDPAANFGWKHDLDVGLLKSDVAQTITLSAVGTTLTGDFGYTILKGMTSSTHGYTHHQAWNQNHDGTEVARSTMPPAISNGFQGEDTLDYGTNADIVNSTREADSYGINTISFDAEAGELYTILFGGYKNGGWGDSINGGYVLDITSTPSAVPVPAAAWLLGSGLIGLFSYGRRKNTAVEA